MEVKCLAQEHNMASRPGIEPTPLDPELGTLTIRPLRLLIKMYVTYSEVKASFWSK